MTAVWGLMIGSGFERVHVIGRSSRRTIQP